MANKGLTNGVQLIAIFNEHVSARVAAGPCSVGTFKRGIQHRNLRATQRQVTANPLLLRPYSAFTCACGAATRPCPGCRGIPASLPPSGCLGRNALDNCRWRIGSTMNAKNCWRWRRIPTLSHAFMLVPHNIAARQTAMPSVPSCPTTFPSPARRSPCFGPSFLTRSGPSSMMRMKRGRSE